MAIIKCKMCGGDLEIIPDSSVAECEYCGSRQTVPKADDQKKLTLFARAGRLRSACEFDKAAGIYESIVADFPEEAEAYWGLVLCKYGIEYVDDPATAKKIPTCHRSSFDSLMDDGDFEQALENCDSVARKVYREEAKQIEELRKGIIAVSSNEQPYDLFICYKETDENGERTLDSVLAQDVYDALTDKGYRVFFSRITLEDKLGQEYEPYIFAALNSAKIMLAFGTDYEYFNAVWVKNEWSRYLKLMAKDKEKHLIPCFKGIDAYDMPKEFAKLQAQDLGKIGAMQDLLRGIEKLLPRKSTVTVQGQAAAGGEKNIFALLDRGNMALEDGDWVEADSFFEDILNRDPQNAQAYLGKALAQEQCHTLEELILSRKRATENASPVMLALQPKQEHIDRMVQKCCQSGYVEQEQIQKLYPFALSYPSEVAQRKEQYRSQEAFWNSHRWLSPAQKFATGAEAERLAAARNDLFSTLDRRIKEAEEAEKLAKDSLQQAYDAHLARADECAAQLHENGMKRLEARYQDFLRYVKDTTDAQTLRNAAKTFETMGDYKDSRELAAYCRKRADEEQVVQDAQRRQEKEKRRKEARRALWRKRWITVGCVAAVIAAVIAVISVYLLYTLVWTPQSKYDNAVRLMESGRYEEAISAFKAMGGYKDSSDQITACQKMILQNQYQEAIAMVESGDYAGAINVVGFMAGYSHSAEKVLEYKYSIAMAMVEAGEPRRAIYILTELGNYREANVYVDALWEDVLQRNTISAGADHAVGLKSDGTVVAKGYNAYNQCNVSEWTEIVAVSAGGKHTVGLRVDRTVVAVGDNTNSQCDVSSWRDIVAIGAGANHTVGLCVDGTVVAVGKNDYGQCNVSDWTDIVAISAGTGHTVGLRADGTVVAVGRNNYDQCSLSNWTDIVAISARGNCTIGLRRDGTVIAVGYNLEGPCNVSEWTDIVAICTSSKHTVGLRSDGTVVVVGDNAFGQCNVSEWTDVVAIGAGDGYTVALRADGTVLMIGDDGYSKQDISAWTDIKTPKQ